MTIRKAVTKIKTETGYDILYPQTSADQLFEANPLPTIGTVAGANQQEINLAIDAKFTEVSAQIPTRLNDGTFEYFDGTEWKAMSGGTTDQYLTVEGVTGTATTNQIVQMIPDGTITDLPLKTVANSASAELSTIPGTAPGAPNVVTQLDSNRFLYAYAISTTLYAIACYVDPITGNITLGTAISFGTIGATPQSFSAAVLKTGKVVIIVGGQSPYPHTMRTVDYTPNSTDLTLTSNGTNYQLPNMGYIEQMMLANISDGVCGLLVQGFGSAGTTTRVRYYGIVWSDASGPVGTEDTVIGNLQTGSNGFAGLIISKISDKFLISTDYVANGNYANLITITPSTGISATRASTPLTSNANDLARYPLPLIDLGGGYFLYAYVPSATTGIRFRLYYYNGTTLTSLYSVTSEPGTTNNTSAAITVTNRNAPIAQAGDPIWTDLDDNGGILRIPFLQYDNTGMWAIELAIRNLNKSNGTTADVVVSTNGWQQVDKSITGEISNSQLPNQTATFDRTGNGTPIPLYYQTKNATIIPRIRLNSVFGFRVQGGRLLGLYKGSNQVLLKGLSSGHVNLKPGRYYGVSADYKSGVLTTEAKSFIGFAVSPTELNVTTPLI